MSRVVLACTAIVFCLVLVLHQLQTEAPAVYAAASAETQGDSEQAALESVSLEAVREVQGDLATPSDLEATGSSPTATVPDTDVGYGFVLGKIYDISGEPVAKGGLSFLRNGRLGGSMTANKLGEYRIRLSEGTWNVFYADQASSGDPARLLVGEVNVIRDQEVLLDVALYGTRTLRGGFFRSDITDYSPLHEVELRSTSDPSRLIASVYCITDHDERRDYEERLEKRRSMDDVPMKELSYPPGMGYFELFGLEPDIYELKVFLDVGKRFYVRMEVDLTEGEVAFAPIPLNQSQFLAHEELRL